MQSNDDVFLNREDATRTEFDNEAPWLQDEEQAWSPEQISRLLGRPSRARSGTRPLPSVGECH